MGQTDRVTELYLMCITDNLFFVLTEYLSENLKDIEYNKERLSDSL